jgi:hypothetical protein
MCRRPLQQKCTGRKSQITNSVRLVQGLLYREMEEWSRLLTSPRPLSTRSRGRGDGRPPGTLNPMTLNTSNRDCPSHLGICSLSETRSILCQRSVSLNATLSLLPWGPWIGPSGPRPEGDCWTTWMSLHKRFTLNSNTMDRCVSDWGKPEREMTGDALDRCVQTNAAPAGGRKMAPAPCYAILKRCSRARCSGRLQPAHFSSIMHRNHRIRK